MQDNVTPFRRQKPPGKPPFSLRDPRSAVIFVHALTAAAFAINWLPGGLVTWIGVGCGVAALAISVSRRDEPPTWARSHFEFALRTVIIAACAWIVSSLFGILPFIGALVVFVLRPIIMLWIAVRAIVGLVRAFEQKPVPNPVTWLV
jgi:uncharacterized membrane protein